MNDWRKRLYDSYVTSGQAQLGGSDPLARYTASGPAIRRYISRFMPQDKSVRVLDLGCGAGGFLYWLKQAGYTNIQGVDMSAEMVGAAHRAGMSEVALGDLHQVLAETAEGSVDVIVIIDVLEHLDRQTLFDTTDLVYRALKKGGRLIAHVPNAEGIFGSRIRWGDLTHELAFTQSSVRQLTTSVGFAQVECVEDRPVPKGAKSFVRAVLWAIWTPWYRLLHAVETGDFNVILSQNLLFVADK